MPFLDTDKHSISLKDNACLKKPQGKATILMVGCIENTWAALRTQGIWEFRTERDSGDSYPVAVVICPAFPAQGSLRFSSTGSERTQAAEAVEILTKLGEKLL